MKVVIVLLVIAAISQASWVQELSADEFQVQVEQKKHIWLVYHSTQQGTHRETINKASEVLNGFYKVAVVTAPADKLELFGDNPSEPFSYSGSFQLEDIISFVLSTTDTIIAARSKEAEQLKHFQEFQEKQTTRANKEWTDQIELRKKSNTVVLDSEKWEAFEKSREAYLINFYEANCSDCINLNKEWELISTEYKGKIKVAKINMTQEGNNKLEDQIKISKYPQIRFYSEGPKKVSEFATFTGINKKFHISQWINGKSNEKSNSIEIPKLNEQNYQQLCKSTKNTCIIVFLREGEVDGALQQIQELGVKHIKKPITFLVSVSGQQNEFAKQLEVESYPDVAMIYCKLKKVWRMGEFNLVKIEEAINEISLGNRNNFQKYSFTELVK